MSKFNTPVLNPSELNDYLKTIVENDELLQDVFIQGELSNVKHYHVGGQLYFTLSDGKSQINAVMYRNFLDNLTFEPQNGMAVLARGKLKVFHKRGTYSLQVAFMKPAGQGDKSLSLEQLKEKLRKEGLFDSDRKQPLPPFPKHVAVITAWNSAAMWDFIRILHEEAPIIEPLIIPATMQGDSAPTSVSTAIQVASSLEKIDAICLIRGGGSQEDLACFNDENLVRTLAACPKPLITGIGHEVDYTLADFASDFRSPTPTAVAKTLANPWIEVKKTLIYTIQTCNHLIINKVESLKDKTLSYYDAASTALNQKLDSTLLKFQTLEKRVELANPLYQLRKGYSLCIDPKTNQTIRSVNNLEIGSPIQTQLADGTCESTITSLKKSKSPFTIPK